MRLGCFGSSGSDSGGGGGSNNNKSNSRDSGTIQNLYFHMKIVLYCISSFLPPSTSYFGSAQAQSFVSSCGCIYVSGALSNFYTIFSTSTAENSTDDNISTTLCA